jgi:hypothetical protein
MNKLLYVLMAAVFAASSFSAVAAESAAPKAGAMAPAAAATEAAPAAMENASPRMKMKHRQPRDPARAAVMENCRKQAADKGMKRGPDRTAFIKDCLSKGATAAPATEGAAAIPAATVPAAKKVDKTPAAKQ